MLKKIKAYFSFFTGMTNICFWIILIFNKDPFYYLEPPVLFDSIIIVDIFGSCVLILAGITFIFNSPLSDLLFFAGGGMYIYSISLSIGYYSQLQKKAVVIIFFVLLLIMIVLLAVSLFNVYKNAKHNSLLNSAYIQTKTTNQDSNN